MKLVRRAFGGKSTVEGNVGSCRHPDEVIADELAQNARTWAALRRLGVWPGTNLQLMFRFETAGSEADCELAEFLRRHAGYKVVIDREGIIGWTPPMALDRPALDDWVRMLLYASYEHGGCVFGGWSATVDCARGQAAPTVGEASVAERTRLVGSRAG
jgi:hypothetical protein